jgi:hypothetical protein
MRRLQKAPFADGQVKSGMGGLMTIVIGSIVPLLSSCVSTTPSRELLIAIRENRDVAMVCGPSDPVWNPAGDVYKIRLTSDSQPHTPPTLIVKGNEYDGEKGLVSAMKNADVSAILQVDCRSEYSPVESERTFAYVLAKPVGSRKRHMRFESIADILTPVP